jgi:hypothetical protein
MAINRVLFAVWPMLVTVHRCSRTRTARDRTGLGQLISVKGRFYWTFLALVGSSTVTGVP